MADSILLNVVQQMENIAGAFAPAGTKPFMFVLAFLLIFTIVYNALIMTGAKLFGGAKQGPMRVIIAFAIAYISTLSPMVIQVIERTFPSLSVFLIGSVALMFTLYFIFPDIANKLMGSPLMGLVVGGSVLLIFYVGLTGGAILETREGGIVLFNFLISDYDIALIILAAGFLLTLGWIFKSPKEEEDKSGADIKKQLKWLLGLE